VTLGPLDAERDLLVVIDDVALEAGCARFRARGSAGGHNGLESVEAALGGQTYGRLRIGVGGRPQSVDLADWVLSEFDDPEDEDAVLELLPELAEAVEIWAREGIEFVMNRFNAKLGAKGKNDEEDR
jgi:PTH1 family peptidyl-tRNA hydrolase